MDRRWKTAVHKTMKRYKSCLLLFLIALCASAALGLWALNGIPQRAEATFGPPSPALSSGQRILFSWRLLRAADDLTTPVNLWGTEIPFQISLGESPTSVAQRLEDAGLVPDGAAFRNFLIYAGLDTQLQAGDYALSPALPATEIAYALLDATPAEVPFAILAGWRLEEIAESLPTSGLAIAPEVFLREAHDRNLEGYLLPGVYIVPRNVSAKTLLEVLTAAFEQAVTPEMQAGFTNQGLSLDEAVRLASIVQRETVVVDEMPLIASVFLNRLALGMKLESDPTVQYAVGYNAAQKTWWTNPLSRADLAFDSVYNTYLYAGLPPDAICNPSLEALRAVAFPAQTPYYYFRAACDGSGQHNFAETYEEHLGNGCP